VHMPASQTAAAAETPCTDTWCVALVHRARTLLDSLPLTHSFSDTSSVRRKRSHSAPAVLRWLKLPKKDAPVGAAACDAQSACASSVSVLRTLKLLPIVKHVQNAVELHFGGVAQIVGPADGPHGCGEALACERAGRTVRRLLAAR